MMLLLLATSLILETILRVGILRMVSELRSAIEAIVASLILELRRALRLVLSVVLILYLVVMLLRYRMTMNLRSPRHYGCLMVLERVRKAGRILTLILMALPGMWAGIIRGRVVSDGRRVTKGVAIVCLGWLGALLLRRNRGRGRRGLKGGKGAIGHFSLFDSIEFVASERPPLIFRVPAFDHPSWVSYRIVSSAAQLCVASAMWTQKLDANW